jgi:uncharacterized protein (TIGR01777 family)
VKVLVTGATGLIGSALTSHLESRGHEVVRVTRSEPRGAGEFRWDPTGGEIDPRAFDGVDAVVHLAGESVAGRWTDSKKRRIRDSRVLGTRLIAEAASSRPAPPRVMVSASAIGYYGNRDQPVTEQSPPGEGFLARVVQEWERAADPARAAGIRVVHPRFGIVQSGRGGALRAQLPLFRLGLGGRVGNGRQWISWVAIDDVVDAILHALDSESLSGPANVTAPAPVTNADYARTLGRVLGRPAILPAPAPAVTLLLGEFASELLGGQAVRPARLTEDGFEFGYPDLEPALRHVLGRDQT